MRKVGVGEQRRSIRNSLVPDNVNSRKFRWYSHLFSLYLPHDFFGSRKERAFFSTWLDWIYACVTSAASRNRNFQDRIRLYPSIHSRLKFPHFPYPTVFIFHQYFCLCWIHIFWSFYSVPWANMCSSNGVFEFLWK